MPFALQKKEFPCHSLKIDPKCPSTNYLEGLTTHCITPSQLLLLQNTPPPSQLARCISSEYSSPSNSLRYGPKSVGAVAWNSTGHALSNQWIDRIAVVAWWSRWISTMSGTIKARTDSVTEPAQIATEFHTALFAQLGRQGGVEELKMGTAGHVVSASNLEFLAPKPKDSRQLENSTNCKLVQTT